MNQGIEVTQLIVSKEDANKKFSYLLSLLRETPENKLSGKMTIIVEPLSSQLFHEDQKGGHTTS